MTALKVPFARILDVFIDRDARGPWVLGSNWWLLPIFVVCLDSCFGIFFAFRGIDPSMLDLCAINASLFSTGYVVLILLSPGFSFIHLLVAATLQIATPVLFAILETEEYAQWMIAQLLVTSTLLLLHRIFALPPWRHARFGGAPRKTFSIRALLVLTMIVAMAIVLLRASELGSYYFLMVLMLCGPPVAGWVAALLMTKLRRSQVAFVIVAGACTVAGLCVYERSGYIRFGLEVEPLWMIASAISTLMVSSLLQLPFQEGVAKARRIHMD